MNGAGGVREDRGAVHGGIRRGPARLSRGFRFAAALLVVLGAVALAQETHTAGPAAASGPETPVFRMGVIADCQYCAEEGGQRRYRLSEQKLSECVEHLNQLPLAFVLHLGDFIDRDWASFDVVEPIFGRLRAPGHHVLGNHDFSVADERKAAVPERLGLTQRYYSFRHRDVRFIALDGNDISFHAWPAGSPGHQRAETYYRSLGVESPRWNGALGLPQLTWLDGQLTEAEAAGERVILLCHFPVWPDNVHNLWNAAQVLRLVEAHPCVVAWLNGHNHGGNYAERAGIHYLTFRGMVDTSTTAYAVVDVFPDRLEVDGFGREEDRVLKFREGAAPRPGSTRE